MDNVIAKKPKTPRLYYLSSLLVCLLVVPLTGMAENYLEKKDNASIADVDLILKKASAHVENGIFDGKKIIDGANSTKVRLYFNTMHSYHESAVKSWNRVSKKGKLKPASKNVFPRLQKFDQYYTSLRQAYTLYGQQQKTVQQRSTTNKVTRLADQKICIKFRNQISPQDRQRMQSLVSLQRGSIQHYFQDVKSINQQRETIKRVATICAQPEFSHTDQVCLALDPVNRSVEADYCNVPKHEQAILQRAAKNYAVKLMKMLGASKKFDMAKFRKKQGWVQLEGPVSWDSLGKDEKTSKILYKRVKPVFEAVGLNGTEAIDGIQKQNSKNAQLAAAIKQLASTWKLPGDACNGNPCELAEETLEKWYPKAEVITLKQKQKNWIVVDDDIKKIPDFRYRSGWALLRVPGDPFCQLRSWTVNEKYSGGGSYQTPNRANIGYVRWQTCK